MQVASALGQKKQSYENIIERKTAPSAQRTNNTTTNTFV